ncbi:hypothetical protein BOTBODRAFT_544695 [Botryobasidium botryosum FD-172 SS1]|uniref:Uncharacterized protein n=1 Tax=Botryobasidium botryosum (strain FD-172 SS1) TaxID=930990 RepID=A0A067MQD4_BOTB1|nr:hypothetical protein BOTBODRAFT_544695 [Botryobasidium botryosum FD-172 SS1]
MKRQKYSKHQHLLSLLDYAVTSNKPSLRVVVQKLLMDQIIKGIVQYAPVIHFAERREGETWKSILGQAYYHYALKGPARWQSDPALTKGHKERLYVGYGKLVELRESSFVWKHVCGVEKDCVADLERRVIGPGFSGPFVDYLGWASWFDKRFRKQWNYKFRTCHRTPFTACSIKAGALKDNLHDCFATLA